MTLNLRLPEITDLKPRITVLGVGGAGGNAVNNMIASGLEGVEFVVANTDAQALRASRAERKVQMGVSVTGGLGAGADPRLGARAAEDAVTEVLDQIGDSNMVFITAGMGGGTGTGAAPVLAAAAREQGILTVGVVTKPFTFEGTRRARIAEAGVAELQNCVNTLIVIPNQNLFRVATEKTTISEAFAKADDVLRQGVSGITDLMVKDGLVNLDFNDVRAVMSLPGKAMMGTGSAEGEDRGRTAAEKAILNPLLEDVSVNGSRAVLISVIGGTDMTLFEVEEAVSRASEEIDPDANVIFGAAFSDDLAGSVRVTIVATGLDAMPETTSRNLYSSTESASGRGVGGEASSAAGGNGNANYAMSQSESLRNVRGEQGNAAAAHARQQPDNIGQGMMKGGSSNAARSSAVLGQRVNREVEETVNTTPPFPRLPTPGLDYASSTAPTATATATPAANALSDSKDASASVRRSAARLDLANANRAAANSDAQSSKRETLPASVQQNHRRSKQEQPSARTAAPAGSAQHPSSLKAVLNLARNQEQQESGESGVGQGMLKALRKVGTALRTHNTRATLSVSSETSPAAQQRSGSVAVGVSGENGTSDASRYGGGAGQRPLPGNTDAYYDTPAFLRRV